MIAFWKKYTLNFKNPAGTSRGVLNTKDSYFIFLEENGAKGIGECGILRGLSADDRPDYEAKLTELCQSLEADPLARWEDSLIEWPSIKAGLEMARLDLISENHVLFPSDFTDGFERQSINGLIWMGDLDFMKSQIRSKIEAGFLVLKMKIGALGFEQELQVLKDIRKEYSPAELQLRVDANGAFSPKEALGVLDQLDKLRIHSIEQPIKAGQIKEMAYLCQNSAMPIALDEELIGVFKDEEKLKLLDDIKPRFIILKPSFLGGFKESEKWIDFAEDRGIGWWVTSALESNLGLSAISQWNYNLYGHLASGLGTGGLYTNNFESPLDIVRGTIAYKPDGNWNMYDFDKN
ncbi:MAG: o-succinylbenzoate synthase [Bacteroidetes bacterium]|nr:MAG: o-succinylbenzoate synthase [Bacteroidota bacterium]